MSKILKAHKIKLNPTPEQIEYFRKATRVARDAWNWGLGELNRRIASGESVKIIGKGETLKNEFSAIKAAQFPLTAEVSTYAWQQAFIDLQAARSRYFKFKKQGLLKRPQGWKPRKDGQPFGWPRFKAWQKATPSFYQANTSLKFDGYTVKIARIGAINMAEALRFEGKVMGARISYQHGHWWLSVQVEIEHETPQHNLKSVEVDLGIRYLAVLSDGSRYQNPKALPQVQKKLAQLQQQLERQTRKMPDGKWLPNDRQSKNWHKTQAKINKLYFRIKNLRQEVAHLMTTEITDKYGIIVIEDLDISQMLKDNPTAKWLSDAALYEKRRQLEYKADWKGGSVIAVERFEPTNRQCNACGFVNPQVRPGDLKWQCQNCEVINDKYLNSLRNIGQKSNTSPDYPTETVKTTGLS